MSPADSKTKAPSPPRGGTGEPRGVRLKTSANVRAELGATYREYRLGKIDAQDARTRTYILQVLGAIIRDEKLGEIEAQLEELKQAGVLR